MAQFNSSAAASFADTRQIAPAPAPSYHFSPDPLFQCISKRLTHWQIAVSHFSGRIMITRSRNNTPCKRCRNGKRRQYWSSCPHFGHFRTSESVRPRRYGRFTPQLCLDLTSSMRVTWAGTGTPYVIGGRDLCESYDGIFDTLFICLNHVCPRLLAPGT